MFFFDEAHLLFDDAPKALLEQDRAGGAADPLQGRRRLLRHPDPARHAGRRCSASSATACSTRCAPSRRATRRRCSAAAETFRPNKKFDAAEVIRSSASARRWSRSSRPRACRAVERIRSPRRAAAWADHPEERQAVMAASPIGAKYDEAVDRESAYEILQSRATGGATPDRTAKSLGEWPRPPLRTMPTPGVPHPPAPARAGSAVPRPTPRAAGGAQAAGGAGVGWPWCRARRHPGRRWWAAPERHRSHGQVGDAQCRLQCRPPGRQRHRARRTGLDPQALSRLLDLETGGEGGCDSSTASRWGDCCRSRCWSQPWRPAMLVREIGSTIIFWARRSSWRSAAPSGHGQQAGHELSAQSGGGDDG